MLQASTDPTDQQIVAMLQRYADGVNAYATDLQAGKYDLDPNLLVSFDPQRFAPWSPVDSLVLGRFQAFALSLVDAVRGRPDRPLPEAAHEVRRRRDDRHRGLRAHAASRRTC